MRKSLAVFRDSLAVRRAQAEADAEHNEDLVLELADTALRLNWFDQPELARQFAAEGLAVCREHPDSTSSRGLRALQELAAAHEDLGELEPAVALGEEALVLLEELAANDTRYAGRLIGSQPDCLVLMEADNQPTEDLPDHRTEFAGPDQPGAAVEKSAAQPV